MTADGGTLDRTCSAACIKSGITALVFSAFALSLLHPLTQLEGLQALRKYTSSRLALQTALDFLDSDACWKLLRTEPGLEKRPLVHLEKRTCLTTSDGKLITDTEVAAQAKAREAREREAKARHRPAPSSVAPSAPGASGTPAAPGPPAAPAAPTDLMVGMGSLAIDEIRKPLVALGERETLAGATSIFPFRFGWNIYWWQRRALDLSRQTTPDGKIDEANYNFDQNLSFNDAKALATFQPLDAGSVEQAILEETRITLPNARASLTLGFSTNLIEFGILLSVLYFWIYQQEARAQSAFPARGTLFGAFSRSRTSLVVLYLLVSTPALCASLLAYHSPRSVRIGNLLVAVGVILLCYFIVRGLPRHRSDASNAG